MLGPLCSEQGPRYNQIDSNRRAEEEASKVQNKSWAEQLVAGLVKPETTAEILIRAIEIAARNEERENTVTARDLKRSEVPARRDTKPHHNRRPWRGLEGPSNFVKAVYQVSNDYNMAKLAPENTVFTDTPGEQRIQPTGSVEHGIYFNQDRQGRQGRKP